ncbi:MAG TPA: hypothetical protein VIJ61_18370 [Thermoanaerobaculia bacterium]
MTHAYYGGPCADLGFVLPPGAERLLVGGRMLEKTSDGRLYVLFEADEDGNPIVSAAGRSLRIGLKLLNPAFPTSPCPSSIRPPGPRSTTTPAIRAISARRGRSS